MENKLHFTVDKILWENEDGKKQGKAVTPWKLVLCRAAFQDDFPEKVKEGYSSTDTNVKVFVAGELNKPEYATQAYDALGSWSYDQRKGSYTFKANYISVSLPTEREDVIEFLRHCGARIGLKVGSEIVNMFGCDLHVIAQNAEAIAATIKGISIRGANKIAEKINLAENTQKLVELLKSAGVEYSAIVKIAREYGDSALQIVKENPYQMWREIGFPICDHIWLGLDGNEEDVVRINGAIWSSYGICKGRDAAIMVQYDKLVQTTLLALNRQEVVKKVGRDVVENGISVLLENFVAVKGTITSSDGSKVIYIYSKEDFISERDLASKLVLLTQQKVSEASAAKLESAVETWADNGLVLSGRQKDAVRVTARNPVSVITGGPGTGKTTCLRAIIDCYKIAYPYAPITLMAPTGLAAHRMTGATGESAFTVHKAMGLVPAKSVSGFSQANETLDLSGLIIVDESSMLGIHLSTFLIENVIHCDATRIVFVGDIDQLPPVAQGNFFEDLINSGIVPVTRLNRNFRQEAGSTIIDAAYAINSGNTNLVYTSDFSFIPANDMDIVEKIKAEFTKSIGEFGLQQTFVLTPTHRKGALCTDLLNPILQNVANPKTPQGLTTHRGSVEYRVGDRVICTKNSDGIVNGDIGYVTDISVGESGDIEVFVQFEGCTTSFTKETLLYLDLAYAITVHKSQGCEFESGATCSATSLKR